MSSTDAFPSKFKSVIETVVKSTPPLIAKELQPIIEEINKLSEQISGPQATSTYQSLNELVAIVKPKFDISLRNKINVFNKFYKNFDRFTNSQNSLKKSSKPKYDEFVFIPSKWKFSPDNLTEHQKEKLKEKRVDIPALYNDMSQSQDSQSISLKPWTPKKQLEENSAEPPSQSDDAIGELKCSDTLKSTDCSHIDQPSQSNAETMESPSIDMKKNSTVTDISQLSTPSNEERKRKRVQHELAKLQLSIANADQFLNQGRTRRMSVYVAPKPEQKLRKRSLTLTSKTGPTKRTRSTKGSCTDNSENEIIEASQTLPTTPTTRRGRQKRNNSAIKIETDQNDEKSVSVADKSTKEVVKTDIDEEKNLLLNVSVDSRSIDEETVHEHIEAVIEQTDLDTSNTTAEESTISTSTEANEAQDRNSCIAKDDAANSVKLKDADAPADEFKSNAEILIENTDEAAIPQENNDHSPIEDAHSEVVALGTEVVLTSPFEKHPSEDSLASKMSGILTSPISNKNCSKTTELLNCTASISPILHAKPSSTTDRTSESKNNQQSSIQQMECCNDEIIDADQIKRTDLDNLIKTPMDSPMLQKTSNPSCSTPQSHKDSKRKFQLQGRGAQFLQLMKIRKGEDSSLHKAKAPVHVGETKTTPAENVPANTNNFLTYEDILANNKDLFRFSKVLPSPKASPSNSIMKRNISEITDIDDIESQNQKRKRVSFHDPPVSATKEFIRFAEEINTNRGFRISRNPASPLSPRNVLIRQSRTDSLQEINKFTLPVEDINPDKSETSNKSLKFNATSDDDDDEINALPLLTFSNKDEILQHVFNEYPLEVVLGKYFESGSTLNNSSSKAIFVSQVTNLMSNDETKRKLILEDLSDKFPKEFLDVAFQENLPSAVIERLPATNMLNYITEQAKTDDNLKRQLIDKFSSVTVDEGTSTPNEMKDEFYKLLLKIISHKMSDTQLLDVLDILFEKRRTNT